MPQLYRWITGNTQKIVKRLEEPTEGTVKVRVLESNNELVLPQLSLEPYGAPEILGIPRDETDMDENLFKNVKLSKEDLDRLWKNVRKLTPTERLASKLHIMLGHLPFAIMQRLAKAGILPKAIKKLDSLPPCPACLFGFLHRHPWRTRGAKNKELKKIRRDTDVQPGAGTSCDHLISAQPGLISQVTGTLTHACYWAATIFVDHFPDVFFVSLMRGVSDAETLAAKRAYGHFAALHNVEVKQYHADNLRFNSQSFLEDVARNNQEITFCGLVLTTKMELPKME